MTSRLPRSLRVALAAGVVLSLLMGARPVSAAPTKGTEILWDTWGIPHISAADHPSLFYAYGYAQMEAHSELLLRLYAQARGRGAEFRGFRRRAGLAGRGTRHSAARRFRADAAVQQHRAP